MSKLRHVPFALGLIAALSTLGCATIGHEFSPAHVRDIEIGRTSKGDLVGMFGRPYRRGIDSGDSTWTYVHYKVRMFGEHLKTRDLVVTFTEDARVKSYTYNSSFDE